MANVFVGMSGGVDSSVAALLLQEQGHRVNGIHLQLSVPLAQELKDARNAAERLGIPFHTLDLSQPFRETVLQDFVETYQRGETPNPCIVCNRCIKFGAMLDHVLALGGNFLATGHYARVEQDPATGRYLLKRGADRRKDQSYFLYSLTQAQLAHVLFPLGELSKDQARSLAEQHGLANASKKDSQDICFVPDGDYAAVIERETGCASPVGDFLDEQGQLLGRHKGFIRYTRGQHKGLGLPTEEPLYVLSKDPETFAIRLGPDSALWESALTVRDPNWISVPALTAPITVTVKTRYSQREAEAVITPLPDGRVQAVFSEPQRAITAGQAAVFYDGDTVVGGGTIC